MSSSKSKSMTCTEGWYLFLRGMISGTSNNGIKCLEVDKYECHFSVGIAHLLDDIYQG